MLLFSRILWLSPWELPGLGWQWRERQVVCFFVKIFLPSFFFFPLRKAFSWTSSCEKLVLWTDWNNLMNTWRLSVLFCHNCFFFQKLSLVWIKNNLSWQLITMGKSGVYVSFKSFSAVWAPMPGLPRARWECAWARPEWWASKMGWLTKISCKSLAEHPLAFLDKESILSSVWPEDNLCGSYREWESLRTGISFLGWNLVEGSHSTKWWLAGVLVSAARCSTEWRWQAKHWALISIKSECPGVKSP